MRYLAVFALLLTACGDYSEDDFSEAVVCFEDGTQGRISEVQPSEKDADSPLVLGNQPPEVNAKDARLPCIITEYWDLTAGPGCIYYDCQNCRPEDALRHAEVVFCGHTICLPYNSGWINPGYPIPFGPEGKESVR